VGRWYGAATPPVYDDRAVDRRGVDRFDGHRVVAPAEGAVSERRVERRP
jgi:hypothetical protein